MRIPAFFLPSAAVCPQTMRRLRLFIATLVLLACACSRGSDQRIVAEVNGEVLTVGELKKALADQADNYGADVLHDAEGSLAVKKKILSGMIEETFLIQTAKAKKILISDEEAKTLRDQLRSGYDAGEFEKMLKSKNVSYDAWFEKQKRKRSVEKLIQQEVTGKVSITDAEIQDYYTKYRPLFREPDRIRCRHIVTNKKDKAETIRRLLEKDENFANVAKKFSESPDRENGGDLGYIARGDYPVIFEQACFSLATGQTSDVITSEYGYHLFRVVDKKPGRQKTLSEVRDEVERRLREEKAAPLLRAWLDELYRNQKITIDDKALKEVTLPRLGTAAETAGDVSIEPETQSAETQKTVE